MEKNNIIFKDSEILRHKIGNCLLPQMKATDYFLGYAIYDFPFVVEEYTGETLFSEKISPLEQAIVGILSIDESDSIERIGTILGLNVIQDKAEYEILSASINMLRRHNVIEGDDSLYSLTEEGKVFAHEGKRQEKETYKFKLWRSKEYPTFASFKDELDAANIFEDDVCDVSSEQVDIEIIRTIAEQQAPKVHNPLDERILKSAEVIKSSSYRYQLYVCFFKNVITSEVNVLVYDDSKNCVLQDFSNLIEKDEFLKARLFDCIEESVYIPEGEPVKDIEKIDRIEDTKIEIEVQDGETIQKLHKRALYDEIAFENELNQIFSSDHPDEIWLISPWIGYFFVQCRVPMIEQALKDGTKVFIAYSKNDPRDKRHPEMVHPLAQKEIDRLKHDYPLFFCVELPKVFHTKNVLEIKGNQVIMFSGSFNILSFAIQKSHKIIRGEQMAFVNPQKAKSEYKAYIDLFTSLYVKSYKSMLSSKDSISVAELEDNKLKFFLQKTSLSSEVSDLLDEIDDKIAEIQKEDWSIGVADLQRIVSPLLARGTINNEDKKYLRNKISLYEESAKALDLDDELLSLLSKLHQHIEDLTISNDAESVLESNGNSTTYINEDYEEAIINMRKELGSKTISSKNLDSARNIFRNGTLSNENQVLRYLVSLNLILQAIRKKKEKVITFADINKGIVNLIEKAENKFLNLSIFIIEDSTFFDLFGIQLSFWKIPHTNKTKDIIARRTNIVSDDKRLNLHNYADELFSLVFKRN